MLDIKKIKENPQAVKDGLHAKEVDCDATVDKILVMEEKIRSLKTSTETQTAQKNKLSKENGVRIPQSFRLRLMPTLPKASGWTRPSLTRPRS